LVGIPFFIFSKSNNNLSYSNYGVVHLLEEKEKEFTRRNCSV